MKKRIVALLLAFVLLMSPVCIFAEENTENLPEGYTVIDAIREYINKNYQFEINNEKIIDALVKEMLEKDPELFENVADSIMSGLDDYSVYYTSEEFKEFFTHVEAKYAGIGAYISRVNGMAVVSGFVENSPAERAGVKQGDIIVAVNGEDVRGKDTEIVTGKIKGDEGTSVVITVEREGKLSDVTIVRAELQQETVSSQVFDSNIGYIVISQFTSNTAMELKRIFEEMKNDGVDRFIVDVRNNPGGVTDASVGCASLLLPQGSTVLKIKSRAKGETIYTSTYPKGKKEKLVVLTNNFSASAAEIFAAAIKDNDAGVIVGEKTYGKGTVQTTLSLGEYGGMKVTMAEFFGPNDTPINGVGITPDEVVVNVMSYVEQGDLPKLTFEGKYYLGDAHEQVYALKERLRIMRYFDGTMDNYFDEVLDEAVKKFQSDVGLFPCGDLDFSTQTAINSHVTNFKVIRDSQFERAYEIVKGM